MRISIFDYSNYEPNEEDLNEAVDQPGTMLMEKWLNGQKNVWNSLDEDCDESELTEKAISQLTLRYESITIHQLYFLIEETLGNEGECYGSYAIAMKSLQKEFPKWSSKDLHFLIVKEFPDHETAAEETSQVNCDGIQGPDDNNNNNVNDNNDDFMKEAMNFPPTEVSAPVNMHNNNTFSAAVIRKDEIDVATLDVSPNLSSKYGNNSNGNNNNNKYINNNNNIKDNNNNINNNNNNDKNNGKEENENHNKKNNIEVYDLNGANISTKDGKININGTSYKDDINNLRTEVVIVPPIEVSSPVNMHNNYPFSASVIRKDEIVVVGAFAPSFLYPLLHSLSSLLLPPSAPHFSLPPFPSTSMAFYLSPFLPPPLLYPLVFLYHFNMSVYRTNFPGQIILKSRVRLALPQNGAA
jgi:hypothetical protein